MNTQEREQINQFLRQLIEFKLTEKNDEAENMINEAVSRQPDAAYLLVQRCLLQDQALQAAQAEIANLQQQLQQKSSQSTSKSFLHNNPWAAASNHGSAVPGASGYRLPPSETDGSINHGRTAQYQGASFGSSFLGNIATTAAGVVAGSFLFQGLENLIGHHPSPDLANQQTSGEHVADQTIINNYYGDADQFAHDDNAGEQFASNDYDDALDDSDFDSDWV